jgi:hypothetical protein|tara:strand:+ start:745 stop:1572 length:828 start_codon:yes stop_codon:yes gene_type:complete
MIQRSIKHIKRYGFFHFLINAINFIFSIVLFTIIRKISSISAPLFLYNLLNFRVNLMSDARKEIMSRVCEGAFKDKDKSLKFLEIGTWFGEGSTKLWIDFLPKKSQLYLVDSWGKYISDKDTNDSLYYRMVDKIGFQANHHVLKNIYEYEDQVNNIEIILLRGKSSSVLKSFKENLFDLVYIDGSHYYDVVNADILAAKNIVNTKFSIICGDDLDREINPELIELANENLDTNFVSGFHPGVVIALNENFTKVNVENGFWWVYCIDGKYTDTLEV